jgi:hypothetical protein
MSGSKRDADRKQDAKQDAKQDVADADSFPASDPPASMGGEAGTRAVPPQRMMDRRRPVATDAVTLRRRFPSTEAAKLALESLVRDGPLDRGTANLVAIGREIELSIAADPDDVHRLRGLLARA